MTSQVTDASRLHMRTDYVDSAARIEAANDLSINAGRDFVSAGGVLQSGRDTSIEAGRDILLGSAEAFDSAAYGRTTTQTVTQNGSSVSAGRDFTAVAGRDLSAVASQIEAQRAIDISASGDVTLMSAADESHSAYTSKKLKTQQDHVSQVSTVLTAGADVSISAGKDLALSASRISAGDEAYLVAGGQLALLAAEDLDYSLYDKKKKGSFGSKYTKRDEVTQVTNIGSAISTGGDLMLVSGGDQLYQAAKLDSGADLVLSSGGEITFEAVKDLHQESHEKSKSDLAWTSMKGKGNTDETLRQSQLAARGEVLIKAVDGLQVDVKQIDQATISQSIDAMVAADPQLAWLKDVEKRGDVDWRQVKEIHDSFKYSHSGLGAGAQIVIAILIAYFTAGAASGLVATGASTAGASTAAGSMWAAGAGASLQGIGWANAMVTAGAMGLTSNAAISTVNNKGNLSLVLKEVTSKDALRGYAVSGITAGLTTGLFEGWTGTSTDVPGAAGTTTVLQPGGLSTLSGIGRFAENQMLQNGTSAVLDRALGGDSSFSDALRNSLVNTFAAAGFKWVGDVTGEDQLDLKDGKLPKIALHALMGGLAAEAAGGDFRIGALSAGVNEAVVGLLADQYSQMLKEDKNRLLVMNSQLIGVLTAAVAGGEAKDLQTGSWVAGSATSYNRLLHDAEKKALTTEAAELEKRLGKPGTDLSWEDLLLLAASAELDATENKRLQTLLQMYDPNQPEGQHFAESLLIARESISRLAAQDIVLTWKDGRPIMADGDEVTAFKATGKQFQDHALFNGDSKWTQASGNSWAGEVEVVPEAWKQQFGEKSAAIYLHEIGQVSSSPEEMKDLVERISVIATGGLKDVTWDLDIALAMTGAPAVLRELLAKRVSAAMAEAGGGGKVIDTAESFTGKNGAAGGAGKGPWVDGEFGHLDPLNSTEFDRLLFEKVGSEADALIKAGDIAGVALSRAGVPGRDYISDAFTNINARVPKFPGIERFGEAKEYFTVTNTDLFMTEVSELYAKAGTPLTPQVKQMIEGLVGGGKRFDVQNGIPGLHAEVRAVNSVLTRYPGVLIDDVKVATYKLAPKNGQGDKFEACSNCSGVLENVDVITGRKN